MRCRIGFRRWRHRFDWILRNYTDGGRGSSSGSSSNSRSKNNNKDQNVEASQKPKSQYPCRKFEINKNTREIKTFFLATGIC